MKTAVVVFDRKEHAEIQWTDTGDPTGSQVLVHTEYDAISAGTELAN